MGNTMPVEKGIKTLILNQDCTPLNVVRWKKGLKKSVSETDCDHCYGKGRIREGSYSQICFDCGGSGENPKGRVIHYWPGSYLKSAGGTEYGVPSILANNHMVQRSMRRVPFSRVNIFRRDGFTCQYCGKELPPNQLQLEHVVPRSMWQGNDTPTNWHNIVAACNECNSKKADRTPGQAGMQLIKTIRKNGKTLVVPYQRPKQPSYTELIVGLNPYSLNIPDEWKPYIRPLLGEKLAKELFDK